MSEHPMKTQVAIASLSLLLLGWAWQPAHAQSVPDSLEVSDEPASVAMSGLDTVTPAPSFEPAPDTGKSPVDTLAHPVVQIGLGLAFQEALGLGGYNQLDLILREQTSQRGWRGVEFFCSDRFLGGETDGEAGLALTYGWAKLFPSAYAGIGMGLGIYSARKEVSTQSFDGLWLPLEMTSGLRLGPYGLGLKLAMPLKSIPDDWEIAPVVSLQVNRFLGGAKQEGHDQSASDEPHFEASGETPRATAIASPDTLTHTVARVGLATGIQVDPELGELGQLDLIVREQTSGGGWRGAEFFSSSPILDFSPSGEGMTGLALTYGWETLYPSAYAGIGAGLGFYSVRKEIGWDTQSSNGLWLPLELTSGMRFGFFGLGLKLGEPVMLSTKGVAVAPVLSLQTNLFLGGAGKQVHSQAKASSDAPSATPETSGDTATASGTAPRDTLVHNASQVGLAWGIQGANGGGLPENSYGQFDLVWRKQSNRGRWMGAEFFSSSEIALFEEATDGMAGLAFTYGWARLYPYAYAGVGTGVGLYSAHEEVGGHSCGTIDPDPECVESSGTRKSSGGLWLPLEATSGLRLGFFGFGLKLGLPVMLSTKGVGLAPVVSLQASLLH